MNLTFYGHSCFMVEFFGKKLLFDPFITPNEMAKDIDVESIKPDYILISHAHEDHTADVLRIARQSGAKVIAIWEIYAWLCSKGYNHVHPMNTGGFATFDFGTVQMINAVHSSSFGDGFYGGNPVGFVVTSPDKSQCFYYSGDTALTLDMQLIPMRHKLDFAVLPIGSNFTMDAQDAAIAAEWIKTKKVVGVHFDTFEFIKINHKQAKEIFAEKGIDLVIPEIGKSYSFN
ncbi:metal-dependent hydrolase [bacterium]|nr:MAG: metal-dependent hydrolase [bacterium]